MIDFALAPGKLTYSTHKWNGFGAASAGKATLRNALHYSCTSARTAGSELDEEIALLSGVLHKHAAHLTNKLVSQFMGRIAALDERREAAMLVADPARQAGLERASQRFAERTDYETASLFELV